MVPRVIISSPHSRGMPGCPRNNVEDVLCSHEGARPSQITKGSNARLNGSQRLSAPRGFGFKSIVAKSHHYEYSVLYPYIRSTYSYMPTSASTPVFLPSSGGFRWT